MANPRKDIVYGNLFYIFIFMKTKCKYLVEENNYIFILKKSLWGTLAEIRA